jgi:hypothetical protein
MASADASAIAQLEDLLGRIEPKVERSQRGEWWYRADAVEAREMRVRAAAAIDRFAPAGSAYKRQADELDGYDGYIVARLAGILRALHADFQAGYMRTIEELIHAAVFDDFLELATELASKGYHPPAAVVAGSVLEEHLRKLAEKSGSEVRDQKDRPKSVDALAIELVKGGAFPEPRRKIIAGWYGQRTEAAHGHFDKVIANEVERMIPGIREFIADHPA